MTLTVYIDLPQKHSVYDDVLQMFFMYTLMHASLKSTLKVKMSLFGI